MKRLGFAGRIASYLDPEESLPAAGQGALAVECRADRADLLALLAPLADRDTTLATTAERAFARALSGSCHTPLAAYAIFARDELWLRGLLASRDGATVMRGERRGPCDDTQAADALGRALADEFLARGAARLVDRLGHARGMVYPLDAAGATGRAARRTRHPRHATRATGGRLRARRSRRWAAGRSSFRRS